jgi:hypothetical protein
VVALDAVALHAAISPDSGARLTLSGRNPNGDWTVRFDGGVPGADGARDFAVETSGLTVADVAATVGQPEPLVDGPFGFSGTLTVAADAVVAGKGALTLGPLVATDGSAAPVAGARTRLDLVMDRGGRTVELVPSPIILADGQAIVSGTIDLPEGAESDVAFDLRLGASGRGAGIGTDGTGRLAGRYDPALGLFVVDTLEARTAGATFNAAIRVEHTTDRLSGALSGVFPTLSVDALKALWPPLLSRQARRWVISNVVSGTLTDASVDVAFLDAGAGDPVSTRSSQRALSFRFADLVFRPYPDGPLIRSAAGSARLDGDRFALTLDSGFLDLEDGRRLAITGGTFTVADIRPDPTAGDVSFSLEGPADAAVSLWGRLPFGRDERFAMDPADAEGTIRAEVRLSLPLGRPIRPDDVVYSADIAVRDLQLARPVAGRTLADGNLAITIADGTARLVGEALLDGVKASIDVVQPLAPGGEAISSVDLLLNAADRKTLGLDLGDAVVGPVRVSITGEPGGTGQTVSVDLEPARVRLTPLGIVKPKGEAGTATFVLRRSPDRIVVDDLVLQTGGARVSGSLVLDGNGRLMEADLPRIVARAGDQVSLVARREASGSLDVTIRGKRFDARRLVRSLLRGGPAAGDIGSIRIDATIDTVVGQGGETLTGVNIAAASDDGHLTALALTAQTAGSGAASMTLSPSGRTRRLEAEVGEVGRVLRFLGLYGRVEGGRAVVSGTVDQAGGIEASVDGSRLRIVEEPALRRLSTAAESGPAAGVASVSIERLLFDIAFADGVLTIRDGVVRATTAGLSLQGDVDFGRDVVRLSGTYLPVSAFDSLLGKIPLIGQTMFAGGRAGLLGVTFRLAGPIDSPDLTVNPLSAIAPGIFRKLFELR